MQSELRSGVLKAFDSSTYLATVQVTGSLSQWLRSIAVSRGIASAEMVTGRRVGVVLFDPTNASDAVVFAVYV
jgi:hypothetical protein